VRANRKSMLFASLASGGVLAAALVAGNGQRWDAAGLALPGRSTPETALRPWSRTFTPDVRFKEVLDGAAFLDRETGLVWEKRPDTTTSTWGSSSYICYGRTVGGRRGWRLPTVEELLSLIDPRQQDPALPPGHPFMDIQPGVYWTGTTLSAVAGSAHGVSLPDGSLFDQVKNAQAHFWCVRGGHGHDGP